MKELLEKYRAELAERERAVLAMKERGDHMFGAVVEAERDLLAEFVEDLERAML